VATGLFLPLLTTCFPCVKNPRGCHEGKKDRKKRAVSSRRIDSEYFGV